MAVQLFLNNTEVIADSSQVIKIVKENPYITQSDSYTLDVSLPLDILQNRIFFGNLQRLDTTKSNTEYDARLSTHRTVHGEPGEDTDSCRCVCP